MVDRIISDNSPRLLSRNPANLSIIADNVRIQWDEFEPLGFDKTGDSVA